MRVAEREREGESKYEREVVERKEVLFPSRPNPDYSKFMRNFRETFAKNHVTILDFRHRPPMMAAVVWKLGYVETFARKTISFAAPSRNFREALPIHLVVLLYKIPYPDPSVKTHIRF